MSMGAGGRGATPQFSASKYRGALPELMAIFRQIEEALASPVEGQSVGGAKVEYVATADNLDSFVVRGGRSTAQVTGLEAFKDNLVVSYVDADGRNDTAELSGELIEVVQKRNRALTQLESFLQHQLTEGTVSSEKREKLQEILSNVSQYQSSLMAGIDRQLKLSEKTV